MIEGKEEFLQILLLELEALFKIEKLDGFTLKLEGFTPSSLLLDIKTIRRKECSPEKGLFCTLLAARKK